MCILQYIDGLNVKGLERTNSHFTGGPYYGLGT